ncbi:hypothetical protein NDU88_002920 [Pleurodeles waltl]|uniref:Uncharacterized protein n=1 Tax=Pleurodeles waltl TaxID=8319 RepID=A0AAV7KU47_PLEWA|nr:hypothetical protein NDU88_002920 [Pleurodeles waltl]
MPAGLDHPLSGPGLLADAGGVHRSAIQPAADQAHPCLLCTPGRSCMVHRFCSPSHQDMLEHEDRRCCPYTACRDVLHWVQSLDLDATSCFLQENPNQADSFEEGLLVLVLHRFLHLKAAQNPGLASDDFGSAPRPSTPSYSVSDRMSTVVVLDRSPGMYPKYS